ncbi:hypothetical protein ACVWXR_002318 [Pseudomonas lurida]
MARVQRRIRVLEDHRGFLAQASDVDSAAVGHVDAIEQHLPGADRVQVQDGAAEGAFAAARLTDQPQGLACRQLQRYTVHRPHPLLVQTEQAGAGGGKLHLKVFDLQQAHGCTPNG